MGTMIFAHRGASKLAPENTMPAFELAYHAGADGIETDVQLTKDSIPILIHDENVRRTTNGTGFVQDYTYEEIKKLDAGTWFSTKFSDTSIVALEEFLDWVHDKSIILNIELKNNVIDYKQLEQIVYDHLQKYQVLEKTVISSFNAASMERMKKIDPNVSTAFLSSKKVPDLPNHLKKIGVTGFHTKYRLLNSNLAKACRQHNLALRIYTVNRPMQMKKCFKLKCDGIFTDVPHLAKEYRKLYK
ncbi:glycerophosphoryl diester phosphodiesterase [Thalassobacillus cyri]|uniref:Glycerophosphoryl diester phosphodiesterase n=2 Tax=Thalassobacillus cyri TaxID=571932 RepID=A0A1H4CDW7_9BACI|nr:glycerophosphodiester phosphodiesterase [Thalassobacillus cyri]SEA58611.1 glycerophosphoryl diester phosphodiesterase [Thalassobacillus cyri]